MITGFNTDVEHNGETYHVQTEDKGLRTPFILSLVYHGGAILAARRTPYTDLIEQGFDEKHLSERLNRQHKLICAAIKAGRLKDLQRKSDAPGEQSAGASSNALTKSDSLNKRSAQSNRTVEPSTSDVPNAPNDGVAPLDAASRGTLAEDILELPRVRFTLVDDAELSIETEVADVTATSVNAVERLTPKTSASPVEASTPHADFDSATVDSATPSAAQTQFASVSNNAASNNAARLVKPGIADFARAISPTDSPRLYLLNEPPMRAGHHIKLELKIADVTPSAPPAHLKIKIIGTAFRPQQLELDADADGYAAADLTLPFFKHGRAVLLVTATVGDFELELRRIIHADGS